MIHSASASCLCVRPFISISGNDLPHQATGGTSPLGCLTSARLRVYACYHRPVPTRLSTHLGLSFRLRKGENGRRQIFMDCWMKRCTEPSLRQNQPRSLALYELHWKGTLGTCRMHTLLCWRTRSMIERLNLYIPSKWRLTSTNGCCIFMQSNGIIESILLLEE